MVSGLCLTGWVDRNLEDLSRSELVVLVEEQARQIELLIARVSDLECELSRHSGNSSKPPSSDTVTERKSQR